MLGDRDQTANNRGHPSLPVEVSNTRICNILDQTSNYHKAQQRVVSVFLSPKTSTLSTSTVKCFILTNSLVQLQVILSSKPVLSIEMPSRLTPAHSSSCSTPESNSPRSSVSSFSHHSLNDIENHEASEQLKRNITEIAHEAAVDARNARKGNLSEEYMRRLVEEVEVELGVRRS